MQQPRHAPCAGDHDHGDEGRAAVAPGEEAVKVVGVRPCAVAVDQVVSDIPDAVEQHRQRRPAGVPLLQDALPAEEEKIRQRGERHHKMQVQVSAHEHGRIAEKRAEEDHDGHEGQRDRDRPGVFQHERPAAGPAAQELHGPYDTGCSHQQVGEDGEVLQTGQARRGEPPALIDVENHDAPAAERREGDQEIQRRGDFCARGERLPPGVPRLRSRAHRSPGSHGCDPRAWRSG